MYKETINTELKAILNEKVKHAISAFLNSSGGTIYVGVSDGGSVIGIKKDQQDSHDTKISSWLREAFFPESYSLC